MMIGHLGWNLPIGVSSLLVFKSFMIADTASAFVFLSGLTTGLVYGRKVLLVLLVTSLAVFSIRSGQQNWIFRPYGSSPELFGALSIFMIAGGWCVDILPMYVVFLLLSPAALSLAARDRAWIVMLVAALAWGVGQSNFPGMTWREIGNYFSLDTQGLSLGIYFNRLSWSAVYFGGLLVGMAFLQGRIDLQLLKRPEYVPALMVSIAVFVGCMLLLLVSRTSAMSPYLPILYVLVSKSSLGVLSLVNFCAATFVLCWLLVAGQGSSMTTVRVIACGMNKLILWRPVVFLGQHSLPVFTFHLAAIYIFYSWVDAREINVWEAQIVLAIGVASLFIPAKLNELFARRKKASTTSIANTPLAHSVAQQGAR
jgi:hypothetical protein